RGDERGQKALLRRTLQAPCTGDRAGLRPRADDPDRDRAGLVRARPRTAATPRRRVRALYDLELRQPVRRLRRRTLRGLAQGGAQPERRRRRESPRQVERREGELELSAAARRRRR